MLDHLLKHKVVGFFSLLILGGAAEEPSGTTFVQNGTHSVWPFAILSSSFLQMLTILVELRDRQARGEVI